MESALEILEPAMRIAEENAAAWVLGLTIAIGTYLVLAFARRALLKRLAGQHDTGMGWVTGLREALVRTSRLFLLVLALYAGAFFVALPVAAERMITSAMVIALFLQGALWAGHVLVGWVTWYATQEAAENSSVANALHLIQLLARVVVWSIAFLLILNNLGFDVTALIAGLGIGGIAIALAAQNILGDLFASLAIVLDQPFVVGDFVIVGDKMGTIEQIGIKTTRIRSLSGEQLVCSNADLLSSRIHNYKRMAERRVVFSIGVTYQTPADKLEALSRMLRAIVEGQERVRFDRAHFARFGDSTLDFEVVYWVLSPDYNLFMDIQQQINLAIVRQLAGEGIDIAYPTRTVIMGPSDRAEPSGQATASVA